MNKLQKTSKEYLEQFPDPSDVQQMKDESAVSKTKTVQGYFGDKQVTRAEFISQWTNTTHQYWHIAVTGDDAEKVDTILALVKEMAAKKWDAMST